MLRKIQQLHNFYAETNSRFYTKSTDRDNISSVSGKSFIQSKLTLVKVCEACSLFYQYPIRKDFSKIEKSWKYIAGMLTCACFSNLWNIVELTWWDRFTPSFKAYQTVLYFRLEHPRFGLICSITALRDICKGEEVLVNYGIGMAHAPQWYKLLWVRHLKDIGKTNSEIRDWWVHSYISKSRTLILYSQHHSILVWIGKGDNLNLLNVRIKVTYQSCL